MYLLCDDCGSFGLSLHCQIYSLHFVSIPNKTKTIHSFGF